MANPEFTPSITAFSITNGGQSEIMIAENSLRQSLLIQPQTEACVINFGEQSGIAATGNLAFDANPVNTETIAINGVTFTFVTGASTSTNVHIGAISADTATNLATVLNASANAAINVATYEAVNETVEITYDTNGTDGNAYTLADSSSANVAASAATLTGGSNSAGGIYLVTDQIAILGATDFPSIKNDVYVVSATTGAIVSYLEGFG